MCDLSRSSGLLFTEPIKAMIFVLRKTFTNFMMICPSALYLCGIVARVGGEGNSGSTCTNLLWTVITLLHYTWRRRMDADSVATTKYKADDGSLLQIISKDFIDQCSNNFL